MVSISYELIPYGFVLGVICIYLINPNDIFKIQAIRRDQRKKTAAIDSDTEAIIAILASESYGIPKPEDVNRLAQKFAECYERLNRSESSFYRFFASTSYRTSLMLQYKLGPFPEDVYNLFGKNLGMFISGLKKKDLVTCYECIANFVFLSGKRQEPIKKLPTDIASKIFENTEAIVREFPNDKYIFKELSSLLSVNYDCSHHCLAQSTELRIAREDVEDTTRAGGAYTYSSELQLQYDAKMYLFLVYLNVVNSNFYDYSQLQEFKKSIVENEKNIILLLHKDFRKYYLKDDILNQCRTLIDLSDETEKIEDYINRIPIKDGAKHPKHRRGPVIVPPIK